MNAIRVGSAELKVAYNWPGLLFILKLWAIMPLHLKWLRIHVRQRILSSVDALPTVFFWSVKLFYRNCGSISCPRSSHFAKCSIGKSNWLTTSVTNADVISHSCWKKRILQYSYLGLIEFRGLESSSGRFCFWNRYSKVRQQLLISIVRPLARTDGGIFNHLSSAHAGKLKGMRGFQHQVARIFLENKNKHDFLL